MVGVSSKNVPLFGVSSRTRSKNVPLFGSLLLGGSLKRRKSDEEGKGLDYVSGSKKRKMTEEPFVVPKDVEVVSIDDDEYEDVGEEGLEHSDEKMSEAGVESGGSGDFDAKDGKFVDENCDRAQDNPIPLSSDESGESNEELSVDSDADNEEEEKEKEDEVVKEGVKSDESVGRFSDKGEKVIIDFDDSEKSEEEEDSDESEAIDYSDEDFEADELNEISDNDNDDSSSSSSYVDDDAEEEEEEEKKEGYRKDFNVVEELVRKVKSKKSGISEGNNEEVNVENSSSYGNDDEEMVRKGKDKKSGISERKCGELDDADHASVSSCTIEKKGSPSSKLNGVSEILKPMSVEVKVKNLSDESVNVGVNAKSKNKSKENVGDSDRGKDQFVKGLDVGGVSSVQKRQQKTKESDKQKTMENKGRHCKSRANICSGEKKESTENNDLNQSVKSTHFTRKELRSLELLVKCYWERKNTMKNDSIVLEVNDDGVDQQDSRPPPVSVDTPRERIWSLKKVDKVQKTKEQEEQEVLWDEFDTVLRESDAESMVILLYKNI